MKSKRKVWKRSPSEVWRKSERCREQLASASRRNWASGKMDGTIEKLHAGRDRRWKDPKHKRKMSRLGKVVFGKLRKERPGMRPEE